MGAAFGAAFVADGCSCWDGGWDLGGGWVLGGGGGFFPCRSASLSRDFCVRCRGPPPAGALGVLSTGAREGVVGAAGVAGMAGVAGARLPGAVGRPAARRLRAHSRITRSCFVKGDGPPPCPAPQAMRPVNKPLEWMPGLAE